jgi:hypothetical protein
LYFREEQFYGKVMEEAKYKKHISSFLGDQCREITINKVDCHNYKGQIELKNGEKLKINIIYFSPEAKITGK